MNITRKRARASKTLHLALAALAIPLLLVSLVPATAQSSNVAPVAKARNAKVKEGKSKNIKLKAKDQDSKDLTYTIVGFPQHGQLTVIDDKKGKVRYTPDEGYTGDDFFNFTVSDGVTVSEPATVSLTIFKKGFLPTGPSLTAAEVQQIVQTAALSINDPQAVIVVIDRPGNPLAVYRRPGASQNDIDRALAVARAGAFFSSDEAPLSSRTIRVLGGIHFPAQVAFTPSSDLYGIELTNRGCDYNVDYNPGKAYPRSTSFGSANRPGLGIGTGKLDLFDSDPDAVDPGGFPLYKNGRIAGGIGVTVPFPRNLGKQGPNAQVTASEFAAFQAAAPGLIQLLPLPFPGRVILGGIELPFSPYLDAFEQGFEIPLPPGAGGGSFNPNHFVFGPVNGTFAPEGYLIGPRSGSLLTAAEVDAIIQRGITESNRTRAAIRLPVGKPAKMAFAVADVDGTILALFRMKDSTVFSNDVALTKSRNVVYLSSPAGSVDLPGLPPGTAVTALTMYFGGQPLFPIGINGTDPGPFFDLFVQDALNPCTQGSQRPNPNQSGIVWFPGSSPLYKGNTMVGGFGVSGDGVTQDNVVTTAGIVGLEAPFSIQSDNYFIRGVRMPYLKFNRNPFTP